MFLPGLTRGLTRPPSSGGGFFAGAVIDMDFANARYLGASPISLATTRASTGYADDTSGIWTSFPSNTPRITNKGLLVEEARTNLFLNSGTPATQTVSVVSGTVYTVSLLGSGSIVLSGAGTGTVTQGSPVTFTASTTSLTATVSGAGGTFPNMQCEAGAFATSPIRTTGAAATRAADAITTGLATLGAFSLFAQGIPQAPIGVAQGIAQIDDGTVNNRFQLFRNGADGFARLGTTVGGSGVATIATTLWAQNVRGKLASASTDNDRALAFNGAAAATSAAVFVEPSLNRLIIGALSSAGSSSLNGYIERVALFNSRLANAQLQVLAT